MSLVNKILDAAMRSSQHVFVSYSPHVKSLDVWAHPEDTNYRGCRCGEVRIFSETVYLDWDGADEKLSALLAQIEELG